jgi:hypothetical protein
MDRVTWAQILADFSDGEDSIAGLTDAEIRVILDDLELLQARGEADIRRAADDVRDLRGRIGSPARGTRQEMAELHRLEQERERLTTEQQERAAFRRALQRQLLGRQRRVADATLRALAATLVAVSDAADRLPENYDDTDADTLIEAVDAALDELQAVAPDWREVAGDR